MPCNAVAVATAQVPLDLGRELGSLPPDAVAQALLALLCQQFAHLGSPELADLFFAHSNTKASGIGARIGNILIRISPDWRVTVNTRYAPQPGDERVVQEIRDAVTGLLTGLARLARQKRISQAIRQAGYRVTSETRAPNGALVLSVDL